jgi:hypothetical protein
MDSPPPVIEKRAIKYHSFRRPLDVAGLGGQHQTLKHSWLAQHFRKLTSELGAFDI